MIACWLLYAGMSESDGGAGAENSMMFAEEAMKIFAGCRTDKGRGGKLQGVSGPSQKRYVHYFEQLKWRLRKEEEEAEEERRERERKRLEKRRKEEERKDTYGEDEEHKEEKVSTAVSPVSLSTRHSYSVPRPTYAIPAHSEEKEHHDASPQFVQAQRPSALSTSPSTSPSSSASAASSSSSSTAVSSATPSSLSPRKSSYARHSQFLSHASSFLYHSPKCEVLSVVLNNAYVSKEHEGMAHGDERSRDEWNDTWNSRDNWSLVITHYRPILPRSAVEDEDNDDDDDQQRRRHQPAAGKEREEERECESDAGTNKLHHHHIHIHSSSSASRSHKPLTPLLPRLNEYNHHRYSDVHEYYFKARPRAADAEPDDTSVTFDISSFESNSRSLILGGDLKFSIWRGKFDVDGDDDGLTSSRRCGRGKGKGKRKGRGGRDGGGVDDTVIPQRKLSRALANPLVHQTPRLFGWFWINTSFLPLSSFSSSGPAASPALTTIASPSAAVRRPSSPRPSELILRKNQLDESFQAADIDSEFNVYVHYFLPALHKEAVQIEELHRDQMQRIKRMEDERKRKEREDRRKRAESKIKEAAGAVHAAAVGGKKGRAGEAVEMADVGQLEAGEAGSRASGVFGQLHEEGQEEDQREVDKEEQKKKKKTTKPADRQQAGEENKVSSEVEAGGDGAVHDEEDDEEDEEEDGELDEEEEEVEAEEAEVEAEEALAEFVA